MTQFITKRTVVECPHGGKGSILVSKQDFVAISNRGQNAFVIGGDLRILTEEDTHLIADCPAAIESEGKIPSCAGIVWVGTGHPTITIEGKKVLTEKSKGRCVASGTGADNGPVKVNVASTYGFDWVDAGKT
jgi:hypothetical protein